MNKNNCTLFLLLSFTLISAQCLAMNTCLLIFDVDETLVSVDCDSDEFWLTESAEEDVCTDFDGMGYVETPYGTLYFSAFAREQFSEIFSVRREINSFYEEPLVLMRILTAGKYPEDELVANLEQFHGPIDLDGFDNADTGGAKKGRKINALYLEKYRAMGIAKKNICLIDDSEKNCKKAEEYGFRAIRMCTSFNRAPESSYTNAKPIIYNEIKQFMRDAHEKEQARLGRRESLIPMPGGAP